MSNPLSPIVLVVACFGVWYFWGNARRAFGPRATEMLRLPATNDPARTRLLKVIRLERLRVASLGMSIPLFLPCLVAEWLRAPLWTVLVLLALPILSIVVGIVLSAVIEILGGFPRATL